MDEDPPRRNEFRSCPSGIRTWFTGTCREMTGHSAVQADSPLIPTKYGYVLPDRIDCHTLRYEARGGEQGRIGDRVSQLQRDDIVLDEFAPMVEFQLNEIALDP